MSLTIADLKLGDLRKDYPNIPIMALTATAPEKVQDDIIRVLGIEGCTVLKQSFNRPNLHYEVRPKNKAVLNEIVSFIRAQPPGVSGIVYCSSREKCEIIAKELRDKDIRAWHYHAGMTKGDRRKIQEGWQEHKFEVIVATIAFGMGIDKPDVRYVIHHSLPRSLEGYYQETGRAGRDGKNSTCILFYTYGDSKTIQNLIYNEQSLSSAQKERQLDNLKEVLRFCNNKTDCRRTQILSFFNEKFDAANCNRGCDVCLGREENNFVIEDVSADARAVVDMMRAFRSTERITVINAADCYRGAKGSAGKDLDRNPYHGAGKHWGRGDAERLIQNLVIEGCLKEYITANRNGWSNSYVTVSQMTRRFGKLTRLGWTPRPRFCGWSPKVDDGLSTGRGTEAEEDNEGLCCCFYWYHWPSSGRASGSAETDEAARFQPTQSEAFPTTDIRGGTGV